MCNILIIKVDNKILSLNVVSKNTWCPFNWTEVPSTLSI